MDSSDISNGFFYSQTHGKIQILEMIVKIRDFLEIGPDSEYILVIGSDSQEKINPTDGKDFISLVTAVTVHRKGSGGIYFYKKERHNEFKGPKTNVRNKIYLETTASLKFAEEFVPLLKENLNGHSPSLEIHVDVGEFGRSRDTIKEVVGMVTGMGYVAKTKPLAYGASKVADKHTK
jgi:uncharacterized protein